MLSRVCSQGTIAPDLVWPERVQVLALRHAPYDRVTGEAFVSGWARRLQSPAIRDKRDPTAYLLTQGAGHFFDHLDRLPGATIGERWRSFESSGQRP